MIRNYFKLIMKKEMSSAEKMQEPLRDLIQELSPQMQFKSLHDLFNPDFFHSVLLAFLPDELELDPSLPQEADESYVNMQKRKFHIIWENMTICAAELEIDDHQNEPASSELIRMVEQFDLLVMEKFLKLLIQLMLKNEKALFLITQMSELHQLQIKQFIQSITTPFDPQHKEEDSSNHKEQTHLFERIVELQTMITVKEQEIKDFRMINKQLSQENEEQKNEISEKEAEISVLKKRILSYSETDLLFEEKDEEIMKLQNQLSSSKMASHVKIVQISKELTKTKEELLIIQQQKTEIHEQLQKIGTKYKELQLQKDEGQNATKKVIQNLKQKIKQLNEKITEQQKNMMDVFMDKQLKQRETCLSQRKFDSDSKNRYQYFDDQTENTQKKPRNKLREELSQFRTYQEEIVNSMKQFFDALFGNEQDRCSLPQCVIIRSQYARIVKKILSILSEPEQIVFFSPESRFGCVENYLKKFEVLVQENTKLKQRIVLLQKNEAKGQHSKQTIEQINKLKKKILILKRKAQQYEQQKKQEIEILVSVLSESIPIKAKG